MTHAHNETSTSEPSTQDGSFVQVRVARWESVPIAELQSLDDWRSHEVFTRLTSEIIAEAVPKGWDIDTTQKVEFNVGSQIDIFRNALPCIAEMVFLLTPLQYVEEQIDKVKKKRAERCCFSDYLEATCQLARLQFDRDVLRSYES